MGVVVTHSHGVRDRAAIPPQGNGQVESSVDEAGGALGDRISVEMHLSAFVAEEVGVL